MKSFNPIAQCPITGTQERITYLDLGKIPLVNNLCESREDSLDCAKYPLSVQLFLNSKLSTLTLEVPPTLLFEDYKYFSGISRPFVQHCSAMFNYITEKVVLEKGDCIVDIGGNDGTLLKAFKELNTDFLYINIDASKNIAQEAEKAGISTINQYWNKELALKLLQSYKPFKVITTTNCLQHTAPLDSFVEGISIMLDDNGVWCLEFPYWKDSMKTFQFDQVYHEHIYYFLLEPLNKLFLKHNLYIQDITRHSIHGGTLRLLVSKRLERYADSLVRFFINEERLEVQEYIGWGLDISTILNNSRVFLQNIVKEGNTLAGFGAAAKGCVFLNSIGIDYKHLLYVIDDTPSKQNKYIPGTGIQVFSREKLKKQPVDYIIILAHNFSDYIIQSLKKEGYEGKFITLLPKPLIVQ
jgi:hypothetical protein